MSLEHGTTLLFGLVGVTVERVELLADAATRRGHVRTAAPAAACPACGVFSTGWKENTTTKLRDLPYGQAPLQVRWHQRRWRCREPRCERKTFTESTDELPPGARLTVGCAGRWPVPSRTTAAWTRWPVPSG